MRATDFLLSIFVISMCPQIVHGSSRTLNFSQNFLYFSIGETYYDRLAIEESINVFLGSPSKASGSSSSDFKKSINLNYDTEVKTVYPSVNFGLGWKKYVTHENFLPVFVQLNVSSGSSKFHLPRGLKPLVEPIDIKANYHALGTQLGLTSQFKFSSGLRFTSEYGMEKKYVEIQSSIQSPILNIESNKHHFIEKYFVRFSHEFGADIKLIPTIQFSHYRDGYSELSLQMEVLIP